MKKLSLLLLLSVFVFCGCSDDDDTKTYVLSLPNYETHTLDMGDTKNPVEHWSSNYNGITTNYYHTILTDDSKLFEFDCTSSDNYGFGSDGFAFTNCTVDNCKDFEMYDYRAVTKKGVTNNTYVIVGAGGYGINSDLNKEVSIRFKDHDNPNELEGYRVKGLYLTNCVYAYNSMKEGSSIFEGKDKFGNTDSFKIIIYNMDKTQSVECTLGEGTQFVTTWKWVDLTSLGETEGLKFNIKTTKEDQWGAMTPTYFCLDGITIED
ncbi:DUF4465 domain-containing protein [Bacteroides caecimuris]|uniref:DUF4465 domain-containing protein n=4 Tax=Bacteroidales TaxID=171549 RepID=UPI002572AE34|nr:DUF4465 domain-containing protein [Bacteroides caecimuris]